MRWFANSRALAAATILLPAALLAGDVDTKFHNAPDSAQAAKNPYAGQEEAAQAGKQLYTRDCLSCHGKLGQGSGKGPSLVNGRLDSIRPGEVFCSLPGATRITACPPGHLCRPSSAGRSLPI
jgi:mono/diheme cytochrome c family protein